MMKRSLLYLLGIISIAVSCNKAPSATGRNGITFKTPVAYNDYIITRQLKIAGLIAQFANSNESIDSAYAKLQKNSAIANECLADISGLSSFNGDTTFRNAAVNSFTFYKRVFEQEYKTLLDINAKGERATQSDIKRANAITEAITSEEAELDKRFINAQQEFAQKNKIQLGDNEETQKRTQNNQE